MKIDAAKREETGDRIFPVGIVELIVLSIFCSQFVWKGQKLRRFLSVLLSPSREATSKAADQPAIHTRPLDTLSPLELHELLFAFKHCFLRFSLWVTLYRPKKLHRKTPSRMSTGKRRGRLLFSPVTLSVLDRRLKGRGGGVNTGEGEGEQEGVWRE